MLRKWPYTASSQDVMGCKSHLTRRFPSALGKSLGPREISWSSGICNPIQSPSRQCIYSIWIPIQCTYFLILLKYFSHYFPKKQMESKANVKVQRPVGNYVNTQQKPFCVQHFNARRRRVHAAKHKCNSTPDSRQWDIFSRIQGYG